MGNKHVKCRVILLQVPFFQVWVWPSTLISFLPPMKWNVPNPTQGTSLRYTKYMCNLWSRKFCESKDGVLLYQPDNQPQTWGIFLSILATSGFLNWLFKELLWMEAKQFTLGITMWVLIFFPWVLEPCYICPVSPTHRNCARYWISVTLQELDYLATRNAGMRSLLLVRNDKVCMGWQDLHGLIHDLLWFPVCVTWITQRQQYLSMNAWGYG